MLYQEIKSLLTSITDPVLKLETLVDIGKTLPPIPAGHKGTEIKGCASRVEIWRDKDGKFYGISDSAIVRGILAVLLSMKEADINFDEFKNLELNLGAQRLNGSAAVIAYLKSL
ncbi:MAG: SufE family protein [Rickettsiales bacterium]|jgi:sulfur transfer protein SufE|nr:SufE family protein [Rickettsiales bacterium]